MDIEQRLQLFASNFQLCILDKKKKNQLCDACILYMKLTGFSSVIVNDNDIFNIDFFMMCSWAHNKKLYDMF